MKYKRESLKNDLVWHLESKLMERFAEKSLRRLYVDGVWIDSSEFGSSVVGGA